VLYNLYEFRGFAGSGRYALRYHAESAQTAGAHVGDDRVSVASVAAGPVQLFVQVQGATRVLAVGSDRSDSVTRPTVVAEKVTITISTIT